MAISTAFFSNSVRTGPGGSGVSTTGGIGTVGGVLVGVLVFELLKIVLQFLGVNPYYNYIVQGLVIVTAVAMDIRKYVAKK